MAIYRSADIINRNIDDVNCVIDVLTKYALHMAPPNAQCPIFMVAIRNGIPIKKHSSAIARFNIYIFVVVCIFENRNTTYITSVFPIKPIIQTSAYSIIKNMFAIGI